LSTALAHAPTADATRLLYERHSSRIFGFCLSRLGSREEAEDAVQTTFLNAQRGLGRGVVPDYELAWLFKIAQNVCHNRHQSARRRGRVEATHDLDALQDVIATPERGGSVSLGDLTQALSAVPERQRRALLLREFQGLSYEEIGVELDVSVAAVETLIFRARRSVSAELGRLGTKPSRRGALTAIAELFSWLCKGGAASLKAAAAVTAVATLAVAPVVERQLTAPRTAPKPVTANKPVHAVKSPPKVVRVSPRLRTSARPSSPIASSIAPPAASTSVRTDSTPVRTDPAPSLPPAASAGPATPSATSPEPPLPVQVSVPDAVSPPALTVPTIDTGLSVPALTVRDLPVTLTPLLPKLP
jgi:RNA polymerase sigma-70 factor (ECF subfamily)